MSHNPYIAGNPTKGGQFLGRDDILRHVNRFLETPHQNAIVLYGQRRIGKTSILLQIEHQLETDAHYTPVYFDLQDRAGKPLPDVLYELAQRIAHKVDGATPARKAFDTAGDYFKNEFLPRVADKARAGGLVLLFDEFDVLGTTSQTPNQAAGDEFFPYLRRWMSDVEDVNFIFVIGRRPEDLSLSTMSTFKGTRAIQVGTMSREETERVIRQSERVGSLSWQDEAVTAVWNWTHGHPYLTQLLCYVVWENVIDWYEEGEQENPQATARFVDTAVPVALQQGANAFEWIWIGLPPAEKIVMSAMAGSDKEQHSIDDVEQILLDSGVQLIVSEMTIAPNKLTEWGLLEERAQYFHFRVPMLREWVRRQKPLRQVKDELDRIDPLANQLYMVGRSYYNMRQLAQATGQLQQAITVNPNHLKANQLLARIYLEQDKLDEAQELLERLIQYDPASARQDLVRVLLTKARDEKGAEQLRLYKRILQINPQQREAKRAIREALHSELAAQVAPLKATKAWDKLLALYNRGLVEFPNEKAWQIGLEETRKQIYLQSLYSKILESIADDDVSTAKFYFSELVSKKPDYEIPANIITKIFEKLSPTENLETTQFTDDPFICGNPLKPSQSVGRKREKTKLLRILNNNLSFIIEGAPKIGKTTLFNYIHENKAYAQRSIMIDLKEFSETPSIFDFWEHVIKMFNEKLPERNRVAFDLQILSNATQRVTKIQNLFQRICISCNFPSLIILVDEFESLIPNLQLSNDLINDFLYFSPKDFIVLGVTVQNHSERLQELFASHNEKMIPFGKHNAPDEYVRLAQYMMDNEGWTLSRIRRLAFDLEIAYDSLEGNREGKIMDIYLNLKRHGRLDDLKKHINYIPKHKHVKFNSRQFNSLIASLKSNQIILGSLSPNAANSLLRKGNRFFCNNENKVINSIANRHPYITQLIASVFWNNLSDQETEGIFDGINDIYIETIGDVYDSLENYFIHWWNGFSLKSQKILVLLSFKEILITFAEFYTQLNVHSNIDNINQEVNNFVDVIEKELLTYEIAYITDDRQWSIKQSLFAWWLLRKIHSVLRDNEPINQWLRKNQHSYSANDKGFSEQQLHLISTLYENSIPLLTKPTRFLTKQYISYIFNRDRK